CRSSSPFIPLLLSCFFSLSPTSCIYTLSLHDALPISFSNHYGFNCFWSFCIVVPFLLRFFYYFINNIRGAINKKGRKKATYFLIDCTWDFLRCVGNCFPLRPLRHGSASCFDGIIYGNYIWRLLFHRYVITVCFVFFVKLDSYS